MELNTVFSGHMMMTVANVTVTAPLSVFRISKKHLKSISNGEARHETNRITCV